MSSSMSLASSVGGLKAGGSSTCKGKLSMSPTIKQETMPAAPSSMRKQKEREKQAHISIQGARSCERRRMMLIMLCVDIRKRFLDKAAIKSFDVGGKQINNDESTRKPSRWRVCTESLAPQYMLFGLGDFLFYVGIMELFYQEASEGMRSLGTGFSQTTNALGYLLSSSTVNIVKSVSSWLPDNINRAHLDYFYWMLALLNLLSFCLFLLCAKYYKYRPQSQCREGLAL